MAQRKKVYLALIQTQSPLCWSGAFYAPFHGFSFLKKNKRYKEKNMEYHQTYPVKVEAHSMKACQ